AEVITGKELDNPEFTDVRGMEGVKEATYNLDGTEVKVAIASGTKNAKVLMDKVKDGTADYTFIEIMGCPGGCINGGGQPVQSATVRNFTDLKGLRAAALYENDKNRPFRKSNENEDVKTVYAEFLGEPNSHKAHELLHTTYVARPMFDK
ncbi:MAG: iron hydrogenase small subunit, partial [Clostridia bacterium]|nr:iron hydrogenase small subunit [Clostridia bacterium]